MLKHKYICYIAFCALTIYVTYGIATVCNISNNLLSHHNDKKLNAKLQEASLFAAAIHSIGSSDSLISAWGTNYESGLKKGNVEDGRVRVNKLEQAHLPGEAVLIGGTSRRILPVGKPHGQFAVDKFKNIDCKEIEKSCCR